MFRLPSSKICAAAIMAVATLWSAGPSWAAENPASHCASVGDDDRVKPIPAGLLGQAIQLFGLPADDAAWAKESTVYRCMGGAVWLCNHGANLTCGKADMRREPPSVRAYCRQNPNEEFVPMAVTGHGVIHSWECVHGKSRIKESQEVDPRGFIASEWRRVEQ